MEEDPRLPVTSPDVSCRRYRIEALSLSYALPSGLQVLRSASCSALPGELLAIVGPSGAGKTTLLSALSASLPRRRRLLSGSILVNGRPMDPASFRRVSGHVAQDDAALFPLLTVEESLAFSARLRRRPPSAAASGGAAGRVQELLKELGLEHVARTRVGGGLSGGERRRVSIGVDLVHDPAVLFLDEPTSGLDSAAAVHVVALLKEMAAVRGKTVVVTVHQPGFRILEMLDRVVVLSGGAVRHQGSVAELERRLAEAGHRVPMHVNVVEFAIDVIARLDVEVVAPLEEECRVPNLVLSSSSSSSDCILYANSRCQEVVILTSRFLKNVLRTKQLFTARIIQSVIAGFGLGTVFMDVDNVQARVGFFAFSLTFLLSSTTEGLPIFLQERQILMRETSRGAYRVSSYVLANAIVFIPILLIASLLYTTPVYWLAGLRREMDGFLYFSLVVWMVMLMANSFVACFSALVPNFIMGNSLVAGMMGSFFLFSGYFISKDNIPVYWIFMHYLSLFKYPFEAFVINEYGGWKGRRECLDRENGDCVLNGSMFLRQQGLVESQKWSNLGVMMGFICGYRILCFVILWFRCCKLRR